VQFLLLHFKTSVGQIWDEVMCSEYSTCGR
jgi:hypothetical protein